MSEGTASRRQNLQESEREDQLPLLEICGGRDKEVYAFIFRKFGKPSGTHDEEVYDRPDWRFNDHETAWSETNPLSSIRTSYGLHLAPDAQKAIISARRFLSEEEGSFARLAAFFKTNRAFPESNGDPSVQAIAHFHAWANYQHVSEKHPDKFATDPRYFQADERKAELSKLQKDLKEAWQKWETDFETKHPKKRYYDTR